MKKSFQDLMSLMSRIGRRRAEMAQNRSIPGHPGHMDMSRLNSFAHARTRPRASTRAGGRTRVTRARKKFMTLMSLMSRAARKEL